MKNAAPATFAMHASNCRCSWDSVIHGCIRRGNLRDALDAFKSMQEASIQPSCFTFIALLKACGKLKDVENGCILHAEIATNGLLQTNQFIGNGLVDMYAKCGMLDKARDVFRTLPYRDVVTWTVLIGGYSHHGHGEEALCLYDKMLLDGIYPNAITFCCLLKACGSIQAVDKGTEIHGHIDRIGLLESNLYVGNALVNMYSKWGMFEKAGNVFEMLPVRDSITWNALISGYVQLDHNEKALNCFEHMQSEGIAPNAVTFCCVLKACGNVQTLDKGREIHDAIARNGFLGTNLFVSNALVNMYTKRGMLEKAREVFDKLPCHDVVSWNALMTGYTDHEYDEEALMCFEKMQLEYISPDIITFSCILKTCGSMKIIDKGREIHDHLVTIGYLEKHQELGSTLIDMYIKCEVLGSAQEVFDTLIIRDVVTWTTLISGYVQHDHGKEALDLFNRMKVESISPDNITFSCILKTCGSMGATDKGLQIHAGNVKMGLLGSDLSFINALLEMYAKCGFIMNVEKVFDSVSIHDVVSWTSLISGYAQVGKLEEVLHIFDRMRTQHNMPDPITFVSVLNACNHGGLVDEGQMYFEAMIKDYGITPTLEHHTCLVDLFGRSGQLEKAIIAMEETLFYPNSVMWHAMLGACRKWGNVKLGRYVFDQILKFDETEIGAYISMHNIYADAGMLDENMSEIDG